MERSGLIEREVRGKRTYRISLGLAHANGAQANGSGGAPRASRIPEVAMAVGVSGAAGSGEAGSGIGETGFDYDELARRLLVQVVRRLAAAEPPASHPDRLGPDQLGPDRLGPDQLGPDRLGPDRLGPDRVGPDRVGPDQVALQETVTGLEYELATAWTKHGKLAEENVRLREQLRAAQRSLALAAERVRRLPVSSDLDRSEVVLLQRLLASTSPDSLGRSDSLDGADSLGRSDSLD